MAPKHICAEIDYTNKNNNHVHSDLCFNRNHLTEEQRKILHDSLDEWLNNPSMTGFFYVGTPTDIQEAFK